MPRNFAICAALLLAWFCVLAGGACSAPCVALFAVEGSGGVGFAFCCCCCCAHSAAVPQRSNPTILKLNMFRFTIHHSVRV